MENKDIINYKHIYAMIRDDQVITIHTSRRNKRTYKNKFWHIGYIGFNEKTSHWCFLPEKNWTFGSDTLRIIWTLLEKLDNGYVSVDYTKKEWII